MTRPQLFSQKAEVSSIFVLCTDCVLLALSRAPTIGGLRRTRGMKGDQVLHKLKSSPRSTSRMKGEKGDYQLTPGPRLFSGTQLWIGRLLYQRKRQHDGFATLDGVEVMYNRFGETFHGDTAEAAPSMKDQSM